MRARFAKRKVVKMFWPELANALDFTSEIQIRENSGRFVQQKSLFGESSQVGVTGKSASY